MKRTLKALSNVAAVILTAPLWVVARLQAATTGGEGWFNAGSELLSLLPGKTGVYVRRGFYVACLDSCATDCFIGFGTTVSHPRVRIGRGAYIGNRCTIGAAVIEADVTIGSNVDILSGRRQHRFQDLGRPIQEQGGAYEQIRIGRNCWIGNSAVIMADVADDCVIGAGSVVVKPIPPRSVAVGNPATIKKQRHTPPAAAPASPAIAESRD